MKSKSLSQLPRPAGTIQYHPDRRHVEIFQRKPVSKIRSEKHFNLFNELQKIISRDLEKLYYEERGLEPPHFLKWTRCPINGSPHTFDYYIKLIDRDIENYKNCIYHFITEDEIDELAQSFVRVAKLMCEYKKCNQEAVCYYQTVFREKNYLYISTLLQDRRHHLVKRYWLQWKEYKR